MPDDNESIPPRRRFLQLTTLSAALLCLPEDGDASHGAETRLNTSLPPKSLPPSNALNPTSRRYHSLKLDGQWTVLPLSLDAEGEQGYRRFVEQSSGAMIADVPGEIHLDLMRAGKIPDPELRDNARRLCRWPESHSWWHKTAFDVPQRFLEHPRQLLTFDGIDLYGQIFVNGKLIGQTKNAYSSATFAVDTYLREGTNELVVRVTSGMELVPIPRFVGDYSDIFLNVIKVDSLYSNRSFDQHRYLRKPAYNYSGWDWCDPLPNIGIWKSVRLEGRELIAIREIRLDTVINDDGVFLQGNIVIENVHPWSEICAELELQLESPRRITVFHRIEVSAPVGQYTVPCLIQVLAPQLWWPNGMGEQPLYRLVTRLVYNDAEIDRLEQSIGLRTIELDRSPLPGGTRFGLRINGHFVFCKGGNWAPADLISARVDTARYERLIADARKAHFTMLRVNGCGLYESEQFYDACDRAGILVWQDFPFSDAQYPDHEPEFLALVREEVRNEIIRLRHHPSLAVWCGNNECELSMHSIWKSSEQKPSAIGGYRIYHEVLPELCRLLDPMRPYWPSSPFGGAVPNSESSGDVHGLLSDGPTQGDKWRELIDANHSRFVSEFLALAPPHIESMRTYLAPDEIEFSSIAWRIHTNSMENGSIRKSIRYHYGDDSHLSVSQYAHYGQLTQALQLSSIMESLRFRKSDPCSPCDGALVWSYNDCWGEIGWSIVDHYERRKAGYYSLKRSASPVKILVRSRGSALVTRVVNDTLRSYDAEVQCGWVRVDGSDSQFVSHSVVVPANGAYDVAITPMPASRERDPRQWIYAATLRAAELPDDQAIWWLQPHRTLALSEPHISSTKRGDSIEVLSPVYCHAVHLDDGGRELLSDNYFDLLPGIPYCVRVIGGHSSAKFLLSATMPIERRG